MSRRESAAPAGAGPADATADVVVVGGGGGGLPAALFARWLGDEVILLEKAPELGGTAKKAAFWYWVPNNRHDARGRDRGPRGGLPALHGAALAPAAVRPGRARRSGSASGSTRRSARSTRAPRPPPSCWPSADALPYRWCEAVPDYWSELPEDKAPTGRVLVPEGARATMSDGGAGRHPHDERGGRARRRRRPRLAPRPAARDRGRRGGRRRGDRRRPARPCASPRARR